MPLLNILIKFSIQSCTKDEVIVFLNQYLVIKYNGTWSRTVQIGCIKNTSYIKGNNQIQLNIVWFMENSTSRGYCTTVLRGENKMSHIKQTFCYMIFVCWTIAFLQRLPTITPCLVWYVWEFCLHASSLSVFPSLPADTLMFLGLICFNDEAHCDSFMANLEGWFILRESKMIKDMSYCDHRIINYFFKGSNDYLITKFQRAHRATSLLLCNGW